MSIVLAILGALLGFVLLLVLLPFRAFAAGSVHDGLPAGAVRIDWGLWLLALELESSRRVTLRLLEFPVLRFRVGTKEPREEERRERARRPKPEKVRKAGAVQRLRAAYADRAAFGRMAARLVGALHLRLRGSGRIGIGDPADTVALAGLLAALAAAPGVELALELDWVEEALELELELAARIWIAEMLGVAALLLLDRAHRRALRLALGRT
jgi:hypothetical protein